MQPEKLALLEKTISLMDGLGFMWVVNSGFKLELWDQLAEGKSLADLLRLHPQWDPVLLDHWLEQAFCLNLLSKERSVYRTTKLGKAVEKYRDQGLEAMYQEFCGYWSPCFARLPDLIRGSLAKESLETGMEDELVSRASLASEPFAWPVLKGKFEREHWTAVLDIGCGEGNYLCKILETFSAARGMGVEINPAVAQRAMERAKNYGGRLKIICADALRLDSGLGRFEVCLLNNNIYYFNQEQRERLLAQVRELLVPGGQLGILTALRDSDYSARIFRTHIPQNLMSFFLACHQGFGGLPTAGEIEKVLKDNGFSGIEAKPLALRTSYYFFGKKN